MSTRVRVVAVDLGATSGRVMAGVVEVDPADPVHDRLELVEVHRFPNGGVRQADGSLRWDVVRIRREVLAGIRLAAEQGPVDAIGIDSWAVDYGLVDDAGELLELPYSHRDVRTDGVREQVLERVGEQELYAVTGLQKLPFNTLFQLVAAEPTPAYHHASTLLLLPDLLAFWLTGQRGAERTNASTTQLYDATTREWALPLLEGLGLRTDLLPPLRDPGEVIGTLLPDVAEAVGLPGRTPVIAVGSHDTASAVVGVPSGDRPSAYLSSGTWSLVGLELPEPILTTAAREADFTNEGGVDGTVRLLRNVMGLWVLSECLRTWAEDGPVDLAALLAEAATLPALVSVVDVDDPVLLPPGEMPSRLLDLARAAGEPVPSSRAEVVRLVLDSLALAYRRTLRSASLVSGVVPEVLHVVGGGSQNELLCRLTADACGLPVVAGPAEAAALGNVLVQARALGVPLPDLAAMRVLLRRTQGLVRQEPLSDRSSTEQEWATAEARLHRSVAR